ncbi:NAD(P)/FAD-dependent oxidoreductase [soil metagenome]
MDRRITRRDFIDGVAVGGAALTLGGFLAGCELGGSDAERAAVAGVAPEAETGMRGLTDAAREIPHQLRDGTFWDGAGEPTATGQSYDLIVVGAGISGLSAARFWQQDQGTKSRVLIIDPLEQPGGHAARNEFTPEGSGMRTLVGYGGSQSIDTPSAYARPAADLLKDVGIEVKRFERYFDSDFNHRYSLEPGTFFNKEVYGTDELVVGHEPDIYRSAPLDPKAREDLIGLHRNPPRPFPGLSDSEVKDELTKLTYKEYLQKHADLHPQALEHLQRLTDDEWGYGIDAVGAIDAWADGYPGFDGLGLDDANPYYTNAPTESKVWDYDDDYIYHFPEGNAGVTRSIIRRLIPAAMSGSGMETIPTTELDYSQLDQSSNSVRIRLRSPVVRVRNQGKGVEVSYVQDGQLKSVRAGQAILDCWNAMIPYICDEAVGAQKEALEFSTKLSLMYANVQLRNWESFAKLGISKAYCPNMYWGGVELDYPVSMGSYEFPGSPSEPIVLHLYKAMTKPGLNPRDQAKAGRAELMTTTLEEIERTTRDQLARILSPGGLDVARDVQAITVNRWAHGYAYEYGRPWDEFWPEGPLPSHVARKQIGRIAIANSDSAPRAYVDSAIDMAWRAVRELLGKDPGEVAIGVDGSLPKRTS